MLHLELTYRVTSFFEKRHVRHQVSFKSSVVEHEVYSHIHRAVLNDFELRKE